LNLRILIIEDEAPMVEILRRFLEPMASQIDSTDNLNQAVEMAWSRKYNVVIQDLRLGRTGKAEGLLAIREFKRAGAAVVVVSGLPEPHLKDDVLAAGADAFVAKDSDFGRRAMLMAINVATLNLTSGSYKSDSYLSHVELLRQLAKQPETKTAS
jgi:DNA-binding response OmpR family regulator